MIVKNFYLCNPYIRILKKCHKPPEKLSYNTVKDIRNPTENSSGF